MPKNLTNRFNFLISLLNLELISKGDINNFQQKCSMEIKSIRKPLHFG